MIEFPILNAADQQFSSIMNGQRVTVRVRYNGTTDRWSFDLAIDDQYVLHGRRIVTGVDLLAPYDFDIGMVFALPTAAGQNPTRDALPAGLVRLYSASVEELEAVADEINAEQAST